MPTTKEKRTVRRARTKSQPRPVRAKAAEAAAVAPGPLTGVSGAPQTEDRPFAVHRREIAIVNVGLVDANPFQPRRNFNGAELNSLAMSIRKEGLINKPIARRAGARIQLAAGERRFRAQRDVLQYEEVELDIREISDDDMFRIAVSENAERADLSPWEWAQAAAGCRQRILMDAGATLSEEDLLVRICDHMAALGRAIGPRQMRKYLRVADALTPEVIDRHGGPEAVSTLGFGSLNRLVDDAFAHSLAQARKRGRPPLTKEEKAERRAAKLARSREAAVRRAMQFCTAAAGDSPVLHSVITDEGMTRGVLIAIAMDPELLPVNEARALEARLKAITKAVRKAVRRAAKAEAGVHSPTS